MSISELSSLQTAVLIAAFLLSLAFGAIAQRTHFCTMGALSDLVAMGDTTRLRQWVLAIGVAMLGFAALAASGTINPAHTLYGGSRWLWLSGVVGGLLFGFGMVLASGCGARNLVRAGGGNLKSLVVLLVLGVSAFATLKGITGVLRASTVDRAFVSFDGPAALPTWTGWVLGAVLIVWALAKREFLRFDNLLAGLGVGAIITAMWWVSGSLGHVAEHPETLEEVYLAVNSGRIEALSFVGPVAYALDWLLFFSDKSKTLTIGIVSVAGVFTGSLLASLAMRRFRWEGFGNVTDLAHHLVGAVLMGMGGVTALGCTVGQGLSGISTLSYTSFTAVAGIVAGGLGALRYQLWRA